MIYLDSAATTLQKPPAVPRAVVRAMRECASPGRGGYPPAERAAELVFRCRREAAALFSAEEPERVVFTGSATHGLNIAIKSVVAPGDRVLVSGYEHNAVLRPLRGIGGVRVDCVRTPLFDPEAVLDAFRRRIDTADAVVCTHVSNVFGFILPVAEIGALCRERGIPFVVDASQSAGILPVSFPDIGADFIALPGHKGLYGPQGTGILLCGDRPTRTLLEGGTGSLSARRTMPDFLPDRLEPGTHNVPGLAGLREGIRFIRSQKPGAVLRHERQLAAELIGGLASVPDTAVYAAERPEVQTGVVSLRIQGMDGEAVGEALGRGGFCVRTGLHCAPAAHESAGTEKTGTVRISFSLFNTVSEVRRFCAALRRIVEERR